MVSIKLKGVNKVRRRLADGAYRVHYYHRASGQRLQGEPGSAEFFAAYAEAERVHGAQAAKTVKVLIDRFLASANFTKLRPSTQKEYRRLLARVTERFGAYQVLSLKSARARGLILEWRDSEAATGKLREAENRITVFARVLAWAVDRGVLTTSPLASWERTYSADRSDKIWTPEQVEAFDRIASPEMRIALYLALYTGQRQADLLALTFDRYANGELFFRQGKGLRNVLVPAVEPLRVMLDVVRESRTGKSKHVLLSPSGKPWRKRHFSRIFKDTSDAAGIVDLTFHDLRGTAVTMLFEAECTEGQIASITGHTLASVSAIIEKYRAKTTAQSRAAMVKLGNYLRTNSANRLQTVADLFPEQLG